FEAALEIDPRDALAHAALADSYNLMGDYGWLDPEEARKKAEAEAKEVLELDDSCAEAHAALAFALHSALDWDGAEQEFKRAIELKPDYAPAHHWYAWYLTERNRLEEAKKEMMLARSGGGALSDIIGTSLGRILYFARDYDGAIECFKRVLEEEQHYYPAI